MSEPICEELEFENPRGERLRGTAHHPKEFNGVGVILCHGMLSSRSSLKHVGICDAVARAGARALRFDFAGRGDSEGLTRDLSYDRQVEDLAAALTLDIWSHSRLVLIGSSMGGAVAILTASRSAAVAAVMGIATVGRPDVVIRGLVGDDEALRRWERAGIQEIAGHRIGWGLVESGRRCDVVDAARRLTGPLVLVHGDEDEIVPIEQARELAAASRQSQLVPLSGGDHVLHRAEDQARLEELAVGIVREQAAFVTDHH